MAGYEIQSPVKQVWLPLDYLWLQDTIDGTTNFKNFAKAYKDKYGIDLHDIFKMRFTGMQGDMVEVGSKIDIVSTYNVGLLDISIDTKLANFNGLFMYGNQGQGETPEGLLSVHVEDVSKNFGHGFRIMLPATGTSVNSIDDLEIQMHEI